MRLPPGPQASGKGGPQVTLRRTVRAVLEADELPADWRETLAAALLAAEAHAAGRREKDRAGIQRWRERHPGRHLEMVKRAQHRQKCRLAGVDPDC